MSTLAESLKRLYGTRITADKLDELLLEVKITQEEYDYITT